MSDNLPAVSQEITTIRETMRGNPQGYWRDAGLQQRYRNLVDADATGSPIAATPAATAELQRLKTLMADRNSVYWRGPSADALQARYRDLIAQGETGEVRASADWRATPQQAIAQLPPAIVTEWNEAGQFAMKLKRVQDHYATIYHGVGMQRFQAFESSFKALPHGAQTAVLRELGNGSPGFTKNATSGELEAFASMGAGATEIIKRWRGDAALMLGRIMTRFDRVQNNLSQMDRSAFDSWWLNTLNARDRVCVLYSLAYL